MHNNTLHIEIYFWDHLLCLILQSGSKFSSWSENAYTVFSRVSILQTHT